MRRSISGAVALLAVLVLSTTLLGSARAVTAERASGERLTTISWGKLRLGMTHQMAWKTGMVSHEFGYCAPGYVMTKKYADRGSVWWKGDGKPFRVESIIIRSEHERTGKGAHVGTTLRKLRKLYPQLSKLNRYDRLNGQDATDKKDYWVVSLRRGKGTLNFQFDYGPKPKGSTKVDLIVINRKQTIFPGC